MEQLADDYRAGRGNTNYPEIIMDDGDAKSFYGAVCAGIKKSIGEVANPTSDAMGKLAISIKNIIIANTKRDWKDNIVVHRNIKKALDDLLFDYIEENHLDWSLDTIDIIIDEIMMVAKKGF
jgi:type I restriction enzyme R subunit